MHYLLQVISRAMPGRDDEYNAWYDDIHIHEVLGVPGFNACARYKRSGPGVDGPPEYVAVYEVETDDPQALMGSLLQATARMQMTDSIDQTTARFEFLEPIGNGRVAAS